MYARTNLNINGTIVKRGEEVFVNKEIESYLLKKELLSKDKLKTTKKKVKEEK